MAFEDFLGLIHRKQGEHLMVYRIPITVLERAGYVRPLFTEAGGHLRFSARARDAGIPNNDALGRTIDLREFREHGHLKNGAREGVCLFLEPKHFDGEKIHIKVLGKIENDTASDTSDAEHEKFSEQMMCPMSDHDIYDILVG